MSPVTWLCCLFEELTVTSLYDILQLRLAVFAVEQNVVYQDCDGRDPSCHHLLGYRDGRLVAYSRLLPPGLAYPGAASIGRVVTAASVRGQGLGMELMERSVAHLRQLHGNCRVVISAQLYLEDFYKRFGFVSSGDPYLEDSIPHIRMEKAPI